MHTYEQFLKTYFIYSTAKNVFESWHVIFRSLNENIGVQ